MAAPSSQPHLDPLQNFPAAPAFIILLHPHPGFLGGNLAPERCPRGYGAASSPPPTFLDLVAE